MLIDKYLPDFHYSEKHSIDILSNRGTIAAELENSDFSDSKVIRLLFWLRGMPSKSISMSRLTDGGFVELERIANDEIVIGLIGQFWKANGNLQKFDTLQFQNFNTPNFLKAAWNFKIYAREGGWCSLSTETRVFCTDESSKRRFAKYWFFVKPFSGLIRMEILKVVKKASERRTKQEVVAA